VPLPLESAWQVVTKSVASGIGEKVMTAWPLKILLALWPWFALLASMRLLRLLFPARQASTSGEECYNVAALHRNGTILAAFFLAFAYFVPAPSAWGRVSVGVAFGLALGSFLGKREELRATGRVSDRGVIALNQESKTPKGWAVITFVGVVSALFVLVQFGGRGVGTLVALLLRPLLGACGGVLFTRGLILWRWAANWKTPGGGPLVMVLAPSHKTE